MRPQVKSVVVDYNHLLVDSSSKSEKESSSKAEKAKAMSKKEKMPRMSSA